MPVPDGFESGIIRVDGNQRGERNRHIATMPADQHQHVVGTGIFRRQAADFDRFSLAEWRDYLGPDAPGREGKLEVVLQVAIPAQSLFFRPVGVDDGLVVDAFFANAILARLGQEGLDSMAR